MNFSLRLSTRNFAEASKIKFDDDFNFIIGEESISCNKFVAAFLSRSVSQILLSDPTANTFHIPIENTNIQKNQEQKINEKECFKEILHQLILGDEININKEEIKQFIEDIDKISSYSDFSSIRRTKLTSLLHLSRILNNEELIEGICRHLFSFFISSKKRETPSSKTGIETRIKQMIKFEYLKQIIEKQETHGNTEIIDRIMGLLTEDAQEDFSEMIKEVASHFFELDESIFVEMSDILLSSILSSPILRLKSEDSLMEILLKRRSFIISGTEKENRHESFIEKVELQYLSETGVEHFLNEIELEDINTGIWYQIKKRLILPVKMNESCRNRARYTGNIKQDFSYDGQNPFNGIIKHLTTTTGGNIVTNKTIEMNSSCIGPGEYETLVDLNDKSGFCRIAGPPRWLQIDFKTRKVQIKNYMIKTCSKQEYSSINALRSWDFEVSNDGNHWEKIDNREDATELNGENKIGIFEVSKEHEPSRFIRIYTEKDNWYDCNAFVISKLELFGQIIEPQ